MSFPRSAGQVPIYYDHENTGRPATTAGSLQQEQIDIGLHGPANVDDRFTSKYLDLPLGPQFSFGHGLSYTTFQYGRPTVFPDEMSITECRDDKCFSVSVTVSNTGDRPGDEVVQLYVRDPVASLAQPVRRLRGFRRITLAPTQSEVVTFQLGWSDLGFWTGSAAEYVIEPGLMEIHIGGTLETTQQIDVQIVAGENTAVPSAERTAL
jgi:beta-glucosidase